MAVFDIRFKWRSNCISKLFHIKRCRKFQLNNFKSYTCDPCFHTLCLFQTMLNILYYTYSTRTQIHPAYLFKNNIYFDFYLFSPPLHFVSCDGIDFYITSTLAQEKHRIDVICSRSRNIWVYNNFHVLLKEYEDLYWFRLIDSCLFIVKNRKLAERPDWCVHKTSLVTNHSARDGQSVRLGNLV